MGSQTTVKFQIVNGGIKLRILYMVLISYELNITLQGQNRLIYLESIHGR